MAVGIGSMVYVGTDMLGVAIIGQAINGLAWGFLEPLQMILIQERADIKYLGRITGFVRFGLMSAGVLPLLAAPFLAEALGVQAVLFGGIDHYCAGRNAVLCHTREAPEVLAIHSILI